MIKISPSTLSSLERGRQVGVQMQKRVGDEIFWITIAVQKVGDEYLSHVDMIEDSKMISEEYHFDETKSHPSLESAMKFIEKIVICVEIDADLSILKGQRLFNPNAETIVRDPNPQFDT
jgi:hypothetical protein